jgi:putative peptidoglycan lipid II flippase
LPLGGLALANSLATALEAAALFIFMRKRLNGIQGRSLADGAWRVMISALGMAIGLLFWIQTTPSLMHWAVTLGGVALGGMIYGIALIALRVPEVQSVMQFARRKIKR